MFFSSPDPSRLQQTEVQSAVEDTARSDPWGPAAPSRGATPPPWLIWDRTGDEKQFVVLSAWRGGVYLLRQQRKKDLKNLNAT